MHRLSAFDISTHAPLAGRDKKHKQHQVDQQKFQPTRPLRGATSRKKGTISPTLFQPTRPLRGATLPFRAYALVMNISTHAPLAGRDSTATTMPTAAILLFQPTRPLRGATSIVKFDNRFHVNFNPRAPCGARQTKSTMATNPLHFTPRAPCGARRASGNPAAKNTEISTHAPLAGRDHKEVE